jgi:hypothetical protein
MGTAPPGARPLLECAAAVANFGWAQAARIASRGSAPLQVMQWALEPPSTLTPTLRACARVILVACLFARKLRSAEPLAAVSYLNPLMEAALRILLGHALPEGHARELFLDVETQLARTQIGGDFDSIVKAARPFGLDSQLNADGYLSLKLLTDWADLASRRRRRGDPVGEALVQWGRLDNLRKLGNGARHTLGDMSLSRLLGAARDDFELTSPVSADDVVRAVADRVACLLRAVGYANLLPPPCTALEDLDRIILGAW